MRVENEQAMMTFGQKIGASCRGGEVIELVGDVGAGKTTLTKGIAHGLGVTDDVQSPSFTLSRQYDARDGLRLVHYDFYRLSDPGILASELDESAHDTNAVIVVEWADIVQDVLPEPHVRITITSPTETSRQLMVEGMTL